MNNSNEYMINMAAAHKGISQADIARGIGITPSNFNQKVKKDSFNKSDMLTIAEFLGCSYTTFFEFPDGAKFGGIVSKEAAQKNRRKKRRGKNNNRPVLRPVGYA